MHTACGLARCCMGAVPRRQAGCAYPVAGALQLITHLPAGQQRLRQQQRLQQQQQLHAQLAAMPSPRRQVHNHAVHSGLALDRRHWHSLHPARKGAAEVHLSGFGGVTGGALQRQGRGGWCSWCTAHRTPPQAHCIATKAPNKLGWHEERHCCCSAQQLKLLPPLLRSNEAGGWVGGQTCQA